MAQKIKQANIFGRIGSGVGRGLAESLPAEMEHGRMQQGLKHFEQDYKNLEPMQQLARLTSIKGMTSPTIQAFADLAKQQVQAENLKQFIPQEFPKREVPQNISQEQASPSLTKYGATQAALQPYIPKNYDQINQRASELFQQNPGFYKQDPQLALQAAVQEDAQEQAISQAQQGARRSQLDVQDRIKSDLATQRQALGAKLPGNIYSEIEDKAINAVLPKEQGGEGLTEQEAMKKYGKDLDSISRDYNELSGLGNWSMISSNPKDIKRSIESIRNNFKKRNDLENFADTLIGENGLSSGMAYHFAYPTKDYPEINQVLNKYPKFEKINYKKGFPEVKDNYNSTIEISRKLAPLLKNSNASPLSIAQELNMRGYDPDTFLDYVNFNRKKIDLTERQGREMGKKRNWLPSLNDLWLYYGTGMKNLE